MASRFCHRQIYCPICYKSIPYNNRKRHAGTHKNILARPGEEWREELRDLRVAYIEREGKVKRLEENSTPG